jgi:hypothetical protein
MKRQREAVALCRHSTGSKAVSMHSTRWLDNIRLGDNVVFQVSRSRSSARIHRPFVRQAIADGRNIIYMRFASHERSSRRCRGSRSASSTPTSGFETFTVRGARRHHARGARRLLRLRQPLRPAGRVVGGPHDGQLLPPDLPVSLRSTPWRTSRSCGRALLRRHRQDPRHHAAAHRRLARRGRPVPASLKVWNRYSPTMFTRAPLRPRRPGEVTALTAGVDIEPLLRAMNDSSVTRGARHRLLGPLLSRLQARLRARAALR